MGELGTGLKCPKNNRRRNVSTYRYGDVSQRRNITRRNIPRRSVPNGEVSRRRSVITAKYLTGEVSQRRSVPTAKYPTAKCPTVNCPTAKCPSAKQDIQIYVSGATIIASLASCVCYIYQ